jgi:hypothetical protein
VIEQEIKTTLCKTRDWTVSPVRQSGQSISVVPAKNAVCIFLFALTIDDLTSNDQQANE